MSATDVRPKRGDVDRDARLGHYWCDGCAGDKTFCGKPRRNPAAPPVPFAQRTVADCVVCESLRVTVGCPSCGAYGP